MSNQQNTNMEETFRINWTGVAKWTVIAGCVAGAYYYGKKQGIKQEASKHQVIETPVEVNEEITEI